MSTAWQRHEPTAPPPPNASTVDDDIGQDIGRARDELAATMSELAGRVTQFPTQARRAARRGLVHPITVMIAAAVVLSVVVWRLRHR